MVLASWCFLLWRTSGLGGGRAGKPTYPHQQHCPEHTVCLWFSEPCHWPLLCLRSDHLHTHIIRGLFAGFRACSYASHVHTEMAKLCHIIAPTVVTHFKEKVWFGAHHRGSVSCENWCLSHVGAPQLQWLFSKGCSLKVVACSVSGLTEEDYTWGTKSCRFYFL